MRMNPRRVSRGLLAGFLICVCAASRAASKEVPARGSSDTVFPSPIPGRVEYRGNLEIALGPVRQILRGARTPLLFAYPDGTLILGSSQRVMSRNWGQTWTPVDYPQVHLNTVPLGNGTTLMIEYDPQPVAGQPGAYAVKRWISRSKGLTVEGPFTGGILRLPIDQFPVDSRHWFHGNTIEMPDGTLLAVIQSGHGAAPEWTTSLAKSVNGGVDWEFVSVVASRTMIADPEGLLTKEGWPLYYACEPFLIHLGGGDLVCVMRSANDEAPNMPESLAGLPSTEYRDLFHTVTGGGIHRSLMDLDPGNYYVPGPPNAPLVVAFSSDGGTAWTGQQPMRQARGCFPRLALSDGILALTYGGLHGVPRWGNAISFSTDKGRTWTDEVNFAPCLTTGYTAVVAVGHGKFLCFFDCTPPQPWTNQDAWWIGCLDISVKIRDESLP